MEIGLLSLNFWRAAIQGLSDRRRHFDGEIRFFVQLYLSFHFTSIQHSQPQAKSDVGSEFRGGESRVPKPQDSHPKPARNRPCTWLKTAGMGGGNRGKF